ncbi:hypothetical protein LCGC14_3045170, partial [marine sediment metagenome]
MPLVKPQQWGFDPGLVAPEWQWVWDEIAYAFIYWNGDVFDLLSGARPDTADLGNVVGAATPFGEGIDHSDKLDFTAFRPLQPGTGGYTMFSWFNRPSGRETAVCQRVAVQDHHMELRVNSQLNGTLNVGKLTLVSTLT